MTKPKSAEKKLTLGRVLLIIFMTLLLIFAALMLYIVFDNSRVVNTEYVYTDEKVPKAFDGYRICLVTDFHNAGNYEQLVRVVKAAEPDIICIGGDMVDVDTSDFSNAVKLIASLSEITTVLYTYGNHEMWSTVYNNTEEPLIREMVSWNNVEFLDNSVKTVYRDDSCINFIGYSDSIYDDRDGNFESKAQVVISELYETLDPEVLSIMVFHRAQYFEMVADVGYDIVLSGHLHGGHVRLPYLTEYILDSHFGTNKYSKGIYTHADSTMYICGGTEKADGIPRVFNTPEIVTLELKTR